MEPPEKDAIRSRRWTHATEPRYWWHRLPGMDFVPPIYSDLSEAEWEIMGRGTKRPIAAG